jgi:hypothetical protein
MKDYEEGIWRLIVRKLSGESKKEELQELDDLKDHDPELGLMSKMPELVWDADISVKRKSADT